VKKYTGTYFGLRSKFPSLNISYVSHILLNLQNIKFHENPFCCSLVVSRVQTDRRMNGASITRAPFERESTLTLNENKKYIYIFSYILFFLLFSNLPLCFTSFLPYPLPFLFSFLFRPFISLSVYSLLPLPLSFLLFTSRLFLFSFPCLSFFLPVWPSHLCR